MSEISYVHYPLHDGFIHHWLVTGPQKIPVEDLERFGPKDLHLEIARAYTMHESGINEQPVEPGPSEDGKFTLEDPHTHLEYEGKWHYTRCRIDHFVDLSTFQHITHYLRAWAYAEIESPTAQEVTLTLTTNGPADIWLNDTHIHRQEHHCRHSPHSVSCSAQLVEGPNRILVRFENVATRDCTYVMALHITPPDGQATALEDYTVRLPTTVSPVKRRNTLEAVFDAAYVTQDYFTREEKIVVHWPDKNDPATTFDQSASIAVRLQTPEGKIYGDAQQAMGEPGSSVNFSFTYQFPNSAYELILMPRAEEYYESHMRINRKLYTWGLNNNRYHEAPYNTFQERRRDGLLNAARLEKNVFSEIAKMAIGWWIHLETDLIMQTIEGINQRRDCSDFYLTGLLGMRYRFGDDPNFPEELRQPLEDCILNFKYWHDEPGSDAMWYWSENHQILFHTCEILAGQLYPDRVFSNNGKTGQWHREHGEQLALAWMRERGTRGFSEWDSNCYFEEDLLALSHLADLGETDEIWEMASILMDKLFFAIAINSYKGIFGSTHGRTYAPLIKGGYNAGTAGISNLMWGMGMFNNRILGTVSLACMTNYELPVLLQYIAADQPEELWNREHHAPGDPYNDVQEGVDKVTYKTPDYMLCSAQDYRPGEPGRQQHIWQATLGPGATVFVNHPSCASEDNSRRPNFWSGNLVLPRVAQWKDVLIAIHQLPADDWMRLTHAYFPVHAFDEYVMHDNWAFAKKEDGYLALTSNQSLSFITTGHTAYRELRAPGLHTVWLCHMGRAALDGDFATFQEKILALEVSFEDLAVRAPTLRGDTLSFAWEGPFLRNDEQVPLHGFKHYDSPYCTADFPATQMDIKFGDVAMRLAFGDKAT